MPIKAYIQGDWVASPVSGSENVNISKRYVAFLKAAAAFGVVNTATWHQQAVGIVDAAVTKDQSTDVLRNYREIDQADIVITYVQRMDPPKKHWGSLALMAYAMGKGKQCILIAPTTCIVWKHHIVFHPLVARLSADSYDQAILYLSQKLCTIDAEMDVSVHSDWIANHTV